MAGAGFKTFSVGDVLTASDVNGYLMSQAVMNFASSGARGSAIGTATEGMLSYLADTDAVEVYDGSAWVGVGADPGIVQVVVASDATQRTTTSATFTSATISVSITPTSADNFIYVYWYANTGQVRANNASATGSSFRIAVSGTGVPGAEQQEFSTYTGLSNPGRLDGPIALLGRYDPSDTSAVTFDAEFRADSASTTVSVNEFSTGHMVAMEVQE